MCAFIAYGTGRTGSGLHAKGGAEIKMNVGEIAIESDVTENIIVISHSEENDVSNVDSDA